MHLVILTRHSETIVDDVVLGPGFQRTRNVVMHLSALTSTQAGRQASFSGGYFPGSETFHNRAELLGRRFGLALLMFPAAHAVREFPSRAAALQQPSVLLLF